MPAYSKKFKEQMLRRMLGPNPITATDLAEETGISQSTLSAWLREARTLGGTRADAPDAPTRSASSASAVPTTTPPTRLHTRTPQDQLRILVLADTLSGEELGAMLRREGLHAAELEAWRTTVFSALLGRAPTPAPTTSAADRKRIQALERELERKDKALAETAALLVLQKKLRLYLEGEDEPMGERSGR